MGIRNGCLQISRVRPEHELPAREESFKQNSKYEQPKSRGRSGPYRHARSRSETFCRNLGMEEPRRRQASLDSRLTSRRRSVHWFDEDCPTACSPVSSVLEFNPKDSLISAASSVFCPEVPVPTEGCTSDAATVLLSTTHTTLAPADCISRSPVVPSTATSAVDAFCQAPINHWLSPPSARGPASANRKKRQQTGPRTRSFDETLSGTLAAIPVQHRFGTQLHELEDLQPHPFGADIAPEYFANARRRLHDPTDTPFIVLPRMLEI